MPNPPAHPGGNLPPTLPALPPFGEDGYAVHGNEPGSPNSFSTFSLTSTMETRKFREDYGRRFQALNDEYSLPADETEQERLDYQHKAFKASQGNVNYLSPINKVLPEGGRGKRGLDVGCGTAAWVIEMCREFPEAEWHGADIAPVWRDENLPDNLSLTIDDINRGLSFPDDMFDVIHVRMLIAGVRNWKTLVDEVLRLLKPGGLAVFVETSCPWPLIDVPEEEQRKIGPGALKLSEYLAAAFDVRGMDNLAGNRTIPTLLRNNALIDSTDHLATYLPWWGWSDDPYMRQAGEYAKLDALEVPETLRLLISDALNLTRTQYDDLKAGWINELDKPGVRSALPVCHSWGFKK